MGPRLELKYGLVAEADRLSTSADAMLVTEPATGSKVRSKGNLYLVVSSARVGGRARDAAALVADTIRREYYYDESAGVPICLEKAVRSANRKLRGSREGGGLPPGALGIAIAVIRNNELYVATIGSAEAYLVRAARLLVPDHTQQPGLPADDALRVEVWRGEIAVGDSLLLVSRNLTEVVGTEELKNAVVTLHPQSAVEHLHHLFVAAGGDGPDAVLAVEATEIVSSRGDRRLAPTAAGGDAFGEMPGGPIPGGDQVAGAAAAVTGAFSGAADSVTGAFGNAIDRLLDLMPRRDRSARGVASQVSRRESQRRAAFALLGLLGVVLVLGLAIWLFPRGRETPITAVSSGEQSYLAAQDAADQGSRLLSGDPAQATTLLHQAWVQLSAATTSGIPKSRTAPLEATIRAGLDELYLNRNPKTSVLYDFGDTQDVKAMTVGPDGSPYYIGPASDGTGFSVWRLDTKRDKVQEIIKTGDGPPNTEGIGTPRLLATQADDLLIVDARGDLWRWQQYDAKHGSLRRRTIPGDEVWGSDVRDIGTLLVSNYTGAYNLYVLDPSLDKILRYQPTLDGNQFLKPDDYLSTPDESVQDYLRLYVDKNVYTLTPQNVVQHITGRPQDLKLETPPDDGDIRPGHTYRLIDGTQAGGKLYIYDEEWQRILVFLKSDGSFVEQWSTKGKLPSMADMRGMYVSQPPTRKGQTPAARVVWATPQGIYSSQLTPVAVDAPAASPAPGATPTPQPTKKPKATKKPG
jgi:hypothetical protein